LFDTKTDPKPPIDRKPALEPGSGGPKDLGQRKMSVEEIETIRKTDPKRYQNLLENGVIKPEDMI
jgi:hypothetical protein